MLAFRIDRFSVAGLKPLLETLKWTRIAVTRKSGLDSMPENKKLLCLMVLLNSAKASYAAYLKTYRSILASDTAYKIPSTFLIAVTILIISPTPGDCTVRCTKGTRLTLRKHSMFHFSPDVWFGVEGDLVIRTAPNRCDSHSNSFFRGLGRIEVSAWSFLSGNRSEITLPP